MPNNKLEKVAEILKLMQNDTITPKEVATMLTSVLGTIKKTKEEFENTSIENLKELNSAVDYMVSKFENTNAEFSKETKLVFAQIQSHLKESIDLLNEVKSIKPVHGKDGVDGKDGVNGQDGKDGKDGSPDTGADIVDKINSLDGSPENQIDAKHIKNLEDFTSSRKAGFGSMMKEAPKDGQIYGRQNRQWVVVTPGSTSPLTTKGDIYTYSTVDARLGVGTNGYILSADSTEATGLKWIPNASATAWSITGNSGLTAGTNFIGTTDAVDFVIKTDGTERMRVTSAGHYQFTGSSITVNGGSQWDWWGGGGAYYITMGSIDGASYTRFRSGTGGVTLYSPSHIAIEAGSPLRWYNSGDSNYVAFKAGVLSGNTTWTLPTADGTSGQFMKTDGSGNLSWASVGSITGSGTTGYVTYWDGTSSITGEAGFTYNAALNVLSVPTLSATTSIVTTFTEGSVVFTGAGGVLAQDNANLFYNDSTDTLNIGSQTPTQGRVNITTLSTTAPAINLRAAASMNGEVLNVEDSAGVDRFQVFATSTFGGLTFGTSIGTPSITQPLRARSDTNAVVSYNFRNNTANTGAASAVVLGTSAASDGKLQLNSANNTAYAGASSLNLVNINAASLGIGTRDVIRQTIDLDGNFTFTQSAQSATNTLATFTQAVHTGGSPVGILFTGGAHTTLTASAEATDVNINLARTVQFATGSLTTQRAMRIQAPTYAFVGASTLTDASTVEISSVPIEGTNATITNAYALKINTASSTATNSYGLYIDSPTGANNNFLFGFISATNSGHFKYDSTGRAVIGAQSVSPLSSTTLLITQTASTDTALRLQNAASGTTFSSAGTQMTTRNSNGTNNNYTIWTFGNSGASEIARLGIQCVDHTTREANLRFGLFDSSTAFSERLTILGNKGQVGISTAAPTAMLHLPAGTATANTAPLKFTSGTLNTTAEAGAMEFLTDAFYATVTTNAVRKMLVASTDGRATGQTAANASVATYTLGAADQTFEVSANVLVTTSSAEAFTVTVDYTDEGNTARTITLNFQLVGGTIGTNIAFANGAVPYEGIPLHIRCKASTTITIKTAAGGTYTGCTYNVEGIIKRTA